MLTRRVGVLTSAIAFIALGIIILLHVNGSVSDKVLTYLWPSLMILFGLEVIWAHHASNGARIGFSGWSVAFLVLIMLLTIGEFAFQQSLRIRIGPAYVAPVKGQMKVGSGIRAVFIDLKNTPVTIIGTKTSTLSYDGLLKVNAPSQAAADTAIQTEWQVHRMGDVLKMTLADNTPRVTLSLLGWYPAATHLNIEIPVTLLSRVVTTNSSIHVTHMDAASTLQTTNGSIIVENVRAGVSARSTNGSITVANVHAHVSAQTTNAAIAVANVQASVFAQSSNGSLTLDDIAGKVTAQTSNASIRGRSMVGGSWLCTTRNGSIQLELMGRVNATLTASTTNGQVGGNIDWALDDRRHGTAVIGTGSNLVNLRTTNGRVAVDTTH